jgi:hypothetical protein
VVRSVAISSNVMVVCAFVVFKFDITWAGT